LVNLYPSAHLIYKASMAMWTTSVPTLAFVIWIVTCCLCVWILLIDVIVTPKANPVCWFKHILFFLCCFIL
ncbi:hypothetical protein, partial [Streptococcus anginosus]|uniref:hypothetical protein n=1 Tax=Streptococcus anginosus TaxID=1328 RepID=UPI0021F8AC6E